jgi:glyoxylase I family protein
MHHIDLAVTDVQRSLAFYLAVLGPVGLREWERFSTYRGTEEVVYLQLGNGDQYLGLRPADGGQHRYYEVGLEHLAFYVDTREEVDGAYQRCLAVGAQVHFPPEDDHDLDG